MLQIVPIIKALYPNRIEPEAARILFREGQAHDGDPRNIPWVDCEHAKDKARKGVEDNLEWSPAFYSRAKAPRYHCYWTALRYPLCSSHRRAPYSFSTAGHGWGRLSGRPCQHDLETDPSLLRSLLSSLAAFFTRLVALIPALVSTASPPAHTPGRVSPGRRRRRD